MVPLFVVAVVAFIFGAIAGAPGSRRRTPPAASPKPGRRELRCDVPGAEPGPAGLDQRREFVKAYREAAEIATLRTLDRARPDDPATSAATTVVPVPITARTVAFGTRRRRPGPALRRRRHRLGPEPRLPRPAKRASTWRAGSNWRRGRRSSPPTGPALAEGPADAREHPLGSAAIDVTGEIGMAEEDDLPSARPPRLPARHPGRHQRPRAGLQRPARRQARRQRCSRSPKRRLGPDHRQGRTRSRERR